MKKLHVLFLLSAFQLSLFASGCKLSVVSFTGPSCALTGQTITVYVAGKSEDVGDDGVTLYGLILQLPDDWEVLSATAVIAKMPFELAENTEYEALYTPEAGYKIWVGTATVTFRGNYTGTATVEVLVGKSTGEFNLKAAVGSYRNEAWTTDDPAGEFNFSDITESKYVHTIIVNYSSIYVSKDASCGGNIPCYASIQDAVHAAATGAAILIEAGAYTESIILNESKSLTLQGGWDSSFSTQTSNTTFIKAPKAPQGSLTLQMVTIMP
ncbi:MAG: hypothetical protein H8E10_18880 [Desulfobacterales bacterium]|nr:hypothetical protein [Desulfobacterales bacterium]